MKPIISGIQQIGVGNAFVHETWSWYRKNFGVDIPVFDEAAEANLMLPYTGGKPHKRHAILAININGGGGFEIWQYTSRKPEAATFQIKFGDLGIYACKIKSRDVAKTFDRLTKNNVETIGEITNDLAGKKHFYLKDLNGNIFEIVEADDWFGKEKIETGGVYGAVIGVSDMDKSVAFYKDILGYDKVIAAQENIFDDVKNLPGGELRCGRVLLTHSNKREGAFSPLLGSSQIELVQTFDRTPNKIFEGRYWGDIGFIHICFDIIRMDAMRELCMEKGHAFTVDSGNFDMGDAEGLFAYIEDPDGTLIEFVETLKIPINKKLGFYIKLKKRDALKPLPKWLIKSLALNRKSN
jgi:catechol 2,3-dioxygenase-like lactoylglutathione lyase family enzyme